MEPFLFREGSGPLLVSMPHVGLDIPDDIAAGMTDLALTLSDTDWHIDRLYDFLDDLGASVIAATHSRYVIDLNRPPDGASLYPGKLRRGSALSPPSMASLFTRTGPHRTKRRLPAGSPTTGNRIMTGWRPNSHA